MKMSDGRMIGMEDTCLKDVEMTLMRHAKEVHWQTWAKKHDIEEPKEGVWLEPVKAMLKRKVSHRWTARHAAQARSWVISGAWTQQEAVRHDWDGQQQLQVLRSRRR